MTSLPSNRRSTRVTQPAATPPVQSFALQPMAIALLAVALFALSFVLRERDPGWYAEEWGHRSRVSVSDAQVGERLRDFPVILDLGGLSPEFWQHVGRGCGDIRVTTSDGSTEVPRFDSSCNEARRTGELRFVAPSLSARSDTRFYLYYGNPEASDYAPDHEYGAQALDPWSDAPSIHGEPADGTPEGISEGRVEARP